jgi:dTDP-glucose 4,6-dehydratase
MKILITGGAGFIGSAVIRKAVEVGHHVINVDCLTYAANLSSLASVSENKNYLFLKQNIRDPEAMSQIFEKHQPDVVLHLAAESHVDRSIDSPRAFLETNIFGTFTLLETARAYFHRLEDSRKSLFRFHHVSTDEVFGDLDLGAPPFSETSRYDPSSPYSASKAASDHLVRAWGRTYGLPIIVTNCSNNYGPFQFPEKLVPVVILKAMRKQPIPVYGSGKQIRDWLYVEDHAAALLTVLQSGKNGETYNIGGNNERTNIDVVTTICRLMDQHFDSEIQHEGLIKFVMDRPGHDKRYAVNTEKVSRELKVKPSVSFDEGFETTVLWYLQNEAWWGPLLEFEKFGERLGLEI